LERSIKSGIYRQAVTDLFTAGALQYFLGTALSYTSIRDLILKLCHRDGRWLSQHHYLLARYLRLFAAGRKSGALISGGQFLAQLAEHFRLLAEERHRGLTVISPALSVIDMTKLVRLQICMEIDDTWAWVALGPERQSNVAAGVLGAAEDASAVDEGDQAVPSPVQAPHQPPPPPPAVGRTMPQRLGRLEEEVQGLQQDVRILRGLVERSMTDQRRFSTWMISCMTRLMEASEQTFQEFDGTFRGSSPTAFQRRTK
ncbi:hypothetical protein Tco_0912354, partial [Tanacetum coccineum]